MMFNKNTKIFLAGDRSQTAKDLTTILLQNGYSNIVGCNTSNLDLRNPSEVDNFFCEHNPNVIFIFAAKIEKSLQELEDNPFAFLNDNLFIALNTINSAIKYQTEKVIYFSSDIALPWNENNFEVNEDDLLKAAFKDTRFPYSLSKAVGTRLCTYANRLNETKFVSLMPCHIYGNFYKGFIFNLVKNFIECKKKSAPYIEIWGDENLKYKFIHSKDLAEAAFFIMSNEMKNDCYIVAPKKQILKSELVSMIAKKVGYEGELLFNKAKKMYSGVNASSKRIMLEGWQPKISLEDGIEDMINWYESEVMK